MDSFDAKPDYYLSKLKYRNLNGDLGGYYEDQAICSSCGEGRQMEKKLVRNEFVEGSPLQSRLIVIDQERVGLNRGAQMKTAGEVTGGFPVEFTKQEQQRSSKIKKQKQQMKK
eukprot:TRINITY_DN35620_c0_g1_i4.p1 TRINITY_DN35620_c0_g1~~TRINITY_DN35620_c0_g1_i4.p1  ORF type:complete len:132 (+),score=13.03 TRINITY_DN35620_c0_g1_i4:60-398(+)